MLASLSQLDQIWRLAQAVTPVNYLPFIFRLIAFLIAFPFALFIALDAIAYGIARTLHLSTSQRRVPRSPLSINSLPLNPDSHVDYSGGVTPADSEDDQEPTYLDGVSARLLELPHLSDSTQGPILLEPPIQTVGR
ncbi:uncharacterized protein MKK02DRAFT_27897 [Dioszegia hungarica]|uniref:Uncharacterized protein n=1 Tax=Dioszegia hungarica TaxID=4972 RepID=A0AA38LUC9_9TREE|nr:uncharacterized protein MKK02DRAFT_27897 [Dioszegia hungarica]KAI9634739.1 hypothetical protein MKK02DRAFT_27897 [Dioszegia hungarica]